MGTCIGTQDRRRSTDRTIEEASVCSWNNVEQARHNDHDRACRALGVPNDGICIDTADSSSTVRAVSQIVTDCVSVDEAPQSSAGSFECWITNEEAHSDASVDDAPTAAIMERFERLSALEALLLAHVAAKQPETTTESVTIQMAILKQEIRDLRDKACTRSLTWEIEQRERAQEMQGESDSVGYNQEAQLLEARAALCEAKASRNELRIQAAAQVLKEVERILTTLHQYDPTSGRLADFAAHAHVVERSPTLSERNKIKDATIARHMSEVSNSAKGLCYILPGTAELTAPSA